MARYGAVLLMWFVLGCDVSPAVVATPVGLGAGVQADAPASVQSARRVVAMESPEVVHQPGAPAVQLAAARPQTKGPLEVTLPEEVEPPQDEEPVDREPPVQDEVPEQDTTHPDEGNQDPCEPNPCNEPGRQTCEANAQDQVECVCDPGHLDVMGFCVAESLSVRTIDVGHGDAILIQLADLDILVDAGQPTSHARERLDLALEEIDGPLEFLVITHPHNDHVGSAAHILESVAVDEVVTNGEARTIGAWQALEDAMHAKNIVASRYTAGDTLEPYPGLVLEFLATGGRYPDSNRGTDINNDSVVMTVSWAGRKVMLTGDIEEDAGDDLVAEYCPPAPWTACPALASDVLKVPHHGSSHQSLEFLRAVQPDYAVVSAGHADRRYHLPRLSVARYLRDELGARVASTSTQGDHDVVLTIDPEGFIDGIKDDAAVYGWEKDEQGEWLGYEIPGVAGPGS